MRPHTEVLWLLMEEKLKYFRNSESNRGHQSNLLKTNNYTLAYNENSNHAICIGFLVNDSCFNFMLPYNIDIDYSEPKIRLLGARG